MKFKKFEGQSLNESQVELDTGMTRLRLDENFQGQSISFTAPSSGEIVLNHGLRQAPSYFIIVNDSYPLKRGTVWNKNQVSFELITGGTARDMQVLLFV